MTTRRSKAPKSGAPVTKAPRAPRGQVVPDLSIWNHGARIGGGITPPQISAILRQADGGNPQRLIDLANECRQRDSHLHGVLASSEESIAGLGWTVTTESKRAKDKRAAKWAEDVLRGCSELHHLIAHLAGAIFYGFAAVEIIWIKEGGKLVPECFRPIAPRRFIYRLVDGQLVQYDPGMNEVDLAATYPNKFIFSFPRVNGDVRPREGLMRPLVWMSVMRNWTIADWLKTGELSWKPWRIGTYKKTGSSAEDREDLEEIMRRMTTDFTAVVPESTSIKVDWPGGSAAHGTTHEALVKALAGEMSKAVLGQTETTESSKSSGYAQAKVHAGVRDDLLESRAKQIASDLTEWLIEPLIRINFGDSVEPPRFEFQTQDEVDLAAFGLALKNIRDAGVRIPEAWAHDRAGIPQPKDGEAVLGAVDGAGIQPGNGTNPDPNQPPPAPQGQGAQQDAPAPAEQPSAEKPAPSAA